MFDDVTNMDLLILLCFHPHSYQCDIEIKTRTELFTSSKTPHDISRLAGRRTILDSMLETQEIF